MENKLIIVGGGHAGIEAAFAASRIGVLSCIVTLNKDAIARLSCNPAVGGLAKSHLVNEIDALGGIMGMAADSCGIQFKTLNKTKGRAVWAHRAQIDKKKYPLYIKNLLSKDSNISILEDEVVELKIKKNTVVGVKTKKGQKLACGAVLVTCGTFLNGLIHVGSQTYKAGRMGEKRSAGLTENLASFGFQLGRLKTGTPPRVSKKSINLKYASVAPGDLNYNSFSLYQNTKKVKQDLCYIVNTNSATHQIINKNLQSSAIFSGKIQGVGPRYCPSIEDKIYRFKERASHQLFLEPEWGGSDQIYINGFSTSLPQSVQIEALRSIKALKNVRFIRPGYAIEYDYFPPRQLKSSLESKNISGLFFGGQINGTSGYEEAAAQGLIGGTNAAKYIQKNKPLVLSRRVSYIGVMIDDLITSHLDEPYRMFTSRAEHRLYLRADNCYTRLGGIAVKNGLLTARQSLLQSQYLDCLHHIQKHVSSQKIVLNKKTIALMDLIKRPGEALNVYIKNASLKEGVYYKKALFELETSIKYEGYIKNEQDRINKNKSLESLPIPENIDYYKIQGLSNESIERLSRVRPENLGQASRVFGIRPTDITIVGVFVSGLNVSRETKKNVS